jgi:hypothetical protein
MADLELVDLKKIHDRNFNANQATRERAADDRVFARVTQWDDGMLSDSQLGYRGEFNVVRKATRQITSDLRSNPVQVDFVPQDDTREDGAEILDGLYLTDDRRNSTLESYDNALMECVDCGVGGWELYTEYETNNVGDRKQVIRRRPLYEANNNSYPDANAKRLDKSDAMNWSILEPFTKEGYQELYKDLVGEETDAAPANFASPEQSYTFPWYDSGNETYYIARIYVKSKVKDKVMTFADPFGDTVVLRESDLTEREYKGEKVNILDELYEQDYSLIDERKIERYEVKQYIASGEKVLSVEVIPGDKIPVVHTYGERTFVEGEEIWEGVVRLAKDPQRLRNFLLSYMADIVSRTPRPKPIFTQEQVAGYEFMYEENGADNNYPYYLQNSTDENGNPVAMGPVGYMESARVPADLDKLAAETREATNDVANPGLPNEFADPDLSGYAIEQLQARFDQQSIVYQQNLKFAKRWDAAIYATMAGAVYDTPRKVTLTTPDGQRQQVEIMETIMDEETGEMVTLRDLTNLEFDVYADISQSYTSRKEKTREELQRMAMEFRETDPAMHKALMYKQLMLTDGVDLDDIRDYGNRQLIMSGIKEPETEEEIAFMEQQAQQEQPPNAEMILAQGELLKGQAAMAREQRMMQEGQIKGQVEMGKLENSQNETAIKAYEAETDRAAMEIDAAEKGVEAEHTKAKTIQVQTDTVEKITDRFRSRVSQPAQQQPARQPAAPAPVLEFDYDPQSGQLVRSGTNG